MRPSRAAAVQLLDGLHLKVVVQRLDPLRSEAGNLQQFGDGGRQFAPQAVEQRRSGRW